MLNNQPPEKRVRSADGSVVVHSIFPTIQGEGPFAGCPAIFIRLAGCNLQCPGCDTDYTTTRTPLSPAVIIDTLLETPLPHNLVVITGGEPFRQNLTPLVNALLEADYVVQIETNGTLHDADFPYQRCTIVVSPKTGSIARGLIEHIDALKYVLHADHLDPRDGLPLEALGHTASPRLARPNGLVIPIYIQPEDTQDPVQNSKNIAACIASTMKFGYALGLQTHKLIGVE